jgi:molecular chaperone HtpG
MVAEKVEIQTLSYQDGATPAKWTCDGSTEFEISEGSRTERGTDVILYINSDSEEFLEEHRISAILDKYAKFLPVPVRNINLLQLITSSTTPLLSGPKRPVI